MSDVYKKRERFMDKRMGRRGIVSVFYGLGVGKSRKRIALVKACGLRYDRGSV